MSKTVIAPVTPQMLVWARQRSNLDLIYVSRKIKVSVETLESWERGEEKPALTKLREIASLYKAPLESFFLPQPPDQYEPPFSMMSLKDFRRLPETVEDAFSPALSLEIREAIDRRAVILELRSRLEEEMLEFRLGVYWDESADDLARRIRRVLSIDIEEQSKWKDDSTALKAWISAIEDIGVLVFQTGLFGGKGVSVEEMRGIAISMSSMPIILLNSKDVEVARIFTLMHELGHILRRVSSIHTDVETNTFSPLIDEQLEVYCNQFAAEILVPAQSILSDVSVRNHDVRTVWNDDEIVGLARRFHVSREVVLRRLLTLELATPNFYKRKRKEYKPQKKEKRGFPVPYDSKVVKWHGENYISTVLRAYHSDLIDRRDVADYLNVKTRWIEPLERRVPS